MCREAIRIWQKLSPVKYMAENLSNMSIPFKSSTKCTTRWCSYNSPGFHFSHVNGIFSQGSLMVKLCKQDSVNYSRNSVSRISIARLPWLTGTRF